MSDFRPAESESGEYGAINAACSAIQNSGLATDQLGLTQVIVFAPVNRDSERKILAQVSLVFANALVVHGIMIERRGNHRVAITYPRVACIGKNQVDVVRPFSRGALIDLEARIIAEARNKGFALITPEPRDELRSALESAQGPEVA